MSHNLKSRYESLHREIVEQFARTAAAENHWLIYALLGWENLIACTVSHYLLEIKRLQESRWIYVVVWLAQIFVALATINFISGRPRTEESPIEPINKRIWTMFLFLSINIAVLNVVAGQPIFLFMPALAALSSFGFTFLTGLISRRFMAAGFTMFVTGILMAKFRERQFLIFGAGWLIVLQTLSTILFRQRSVWLTQSDRVAAEHDKKGQRPAPDRCPELIPLAGRLPINR